jgi:hypothetical protein
LTNNYQPRSRCLGRGASCVVPGAKCSSQWTHDPQNSISGPCFQLQAFHALIGPFQGAFIGPYGSMPRPVSPHGPLPDAHQPLMGSSPQPRQPLMGHFPVPVSPVRRTSHVVPRTRFWGDAPDSMPPCTSALVHGALLLSY